MKIFLPNVEIRVKENLIIHTPIVLLLVPSIPVEANYIDCEFFCNVIKNLIEGVKKSKQILVRVTIPSSYLYAF